MERVLNLAVDDLEDMRAAWEVTAGTPLELRIGFRPWAANTNRWLSALALAAWHLGPAVLL